ncbi:expressed unknown protein [Seminavis robusta]|uniref:Transcription activator GCR1-like domain-containing protein n=1 Tax=Seminavis robusta TaxID=568900 RepID=A0A9N8DXS2_9STRA|nr:expressed unknown protein [Seminavis robusta]|eukprot:Sro448_g145131.1  (183) ;mRNA; r:29597-30145
MAIVNKNIGRINHFQLIARGGGAPRLPLPGAPGGAGVGGGTAGAGGGGAAAAGGGLPPPPPSPGRLARTPAARAPTPATLPAQLSKKPFNLYELWDEWIKGLNGNKAACEFTARERGRVKDKFCRRKHVWDCVIRLMAKGFDWRAAVDRIYATYGWLTVTQIINKFKQDKKNQPTGIHPRLR